MEKTMLLIAVILAVIGAQQAYALSDYQSGYNHGVKDAKDSCLHPDGCHWYILEPGNGFGFHTQEFNDVYIAAMCKSDISSDADEATWSCP
jgi:hypothetical protein